MIDLELCVCAPCTVLGLYPASVELPTVSDVVLTCDLEGRNDSRILVVWVSSVEVMLSRKSHTQVNTLHSGASDSPIEFPASANAHGAVL